MNLHAIKQCRLYPLIMYTYIRQDNKSNLVEWKIYVDNISPKLWYSNLTTNIGREVVYKTFVCRLL